MELISAIWVIVSILAALLCIPIVRRLGPVAINNYTLEVLYDSDNGPSNVIYRVLSPMLCCFVLTSLLYALLSNFFDITYLGYQWVSVLFYWVIICAVKYSTPAGSLPLGAFIVEGTLSVVLAMFFEQFVIQPLYNSGSAILDQSNFAFEMELALFYVVVQIIVSLATRHQYHTANRHDSDPYASNSSTNGIDIPERTIYSYVRSYDNLLTKRYHEDPLLRDAFYTIMAIEDFNRPAGVRPLERFLSRMGLAKTTGIMQQKSNRPLSDEESVMLACEYVEKMWDQLLLRIAQSNYSCDETNPHIVFAANWYGYDYQSISRIVGGRFSEWYGDYRGSRLLAGANQVFANIRAFFERETYCLNPKVVMAAGNICPDQASWMQPQAFIWTDPYTIKAYDSDNDKQNGSTGSSKRSLRCKAEDVGQECQRLKKSGAMIIFIRVIPDAYCEIAYICASAS